MHLSVSWREGGERQPFCVELNVSLSYHVILNVELRILGAYVF